MSGPATIRRVLAGLGFLGACVVFAGLGSFPGGPAEFIGMVLVASPFVVLAGFAGGVSNAGFSALFLALLVGTAFGLYAAGSSSTGALAFLWLLPVEIIGVAVVGAWSGARARS